MKKSKLRELGLIYSSTTVENVEKDVEKTEVTKKPKTKRSTKKKEV